jgi:hypothetical protein
MNELNKIKQDDNGNQTTANTTNIPVLQTNTNNVPAFMKTMGKTTVNDTLNSQGFWMRQLENL